MYPTILLMLIPLQIQEPGAINPQGSVHSENHSAKKMEHCTNQKQQQKTVTKAEAQAGSLALQRMAIHLHTHK